MAEDNDEQHAHQDVPSDIALRVKALETVLTEKGLIDPSAIDDVVERYQNQVGPRNGARVVAREHHASHLAGGLHHLALAAREGDSGNDAERYCPSQQ